MVVNEIEGLGLGVLRMVVVGHNCMQEDVNNVENVMILWVNWKMMKARA